MMRAFSVPFAAVLLAGCAATTPAPTTAPEPRQEAVHDLVISGGTIYDGSGGQPFVGDVAIDGDKVTSVGPEAKGRTEIDATGLAVAPGFINTHSWATQSLIVDGRGMSDLKQGVTTEIFGEGWSMGPLTPEMKKLEASRQGDIKYPIQWTTLGDYLSFLDAKGVVPNVASFVGAATVRIHELGEGDVDPDPAQLKAMQRLVRQAMNEGALGVGSALIYAPGSYAETPELIALTKAAADCGGRYISHMRSEGDALLKAIDELVSISKATGAPAIIYHLKESGQENWDKLPAVIDKVEKARAAGLDISATMYTYTAGATGLDAAMPLWVQDGGEEKWFERLQDPKTRARVIAEMKKPGEGWENLLLQAGSPDRVLLTGFKNDALKKYTGMTLAEVAKERGTSPEETAIDLVVEDRSRVDTIYFLMSEENVAKETALPWVSFGSDAGAPAAEGVFLKSNDHPRAYGNVAHLLGKYVRDEKTTTLQDAVHRLTGFAATQVGLSNRGMLKSGYFADVTVFDPKTIADTATYEKPHQYAVGVRDVFVNGVQVLKNGEPTAARPGRFLKGPGAGRCPA
jgi:N-acyl-D-amino-acid deacylase